MLSVAGMKLFSRKLAENNILTEENSLKRFKERDHLSDNQSHQVLHRKAFTTKMSRSYVQQVSCVAWPRPRSNSFPFIKRWNPLPRVLEEDESLEEVPSSRKLPNVSQLAVQKVNWTDESLSQELLCKINSLRSTLVLADFTGIKLKNFRPRSNSFPLIKGLNPLPCVLEEEEIIGEEKSPKKAPYQRQSFDWNDNNKVSHELFNRINLLRATLSSVDSSSKAQGHCRLTKPYAGNPVGDKLPCKFQISPHRDETNSAERNAREQVHNISKVAQTQTSHVRKPDSTYISLISGFTHEALKQTHAQSKSVESELTLASELKRSKNCKKLKCMAFSPRKLFSCSPPRQDRNQQISHSAEYIPQMGC